MHLLMNQQLLLWSLIEISFLKKYWEKWHKIEITWENLWTDGINFIWESLKCIINLHWKKIKLLIKSRNLLTFSPIIHWIFIKMTEFLAVNFDKPPSMHRWKLNLKINSANFLLSLITIFIKRQQKFFNLKLH